ncbi:O-antigen ligase family protein [Vallitalea okinawensis]|uniref:O-antigen ligase family protein n=1 Tax=Vallitalea okinawensis TaxID=2078660 RepID=UPI0013005823|nr:O-antigen ligase family protein [Vallitalea okinawensis]
MKKSLIFLMVLIGLIPFMRGGYFLHSVYLVGGLSCIILTLKCIEEGVFRIPIQLEALFLLSITALYGISIFIAIDPGMAFLGFLKYIVICVVYLTIQQYDMEKRYKLLDSVMYAGIVMAVLSILLIPFMNSYLIQNNRLGGFVQYANTFALFMVITLLILLERGSSKSYLLIPFIIACIYLTYSRSMYVIAFGAVCIGLFLFQKMLKTLLPMIALGILLGVVLSQFTIFQESINRVKETSFQVSEFQSRLIYYEDGIDIIKDNPVGLGYYGYFYLQRAYASGVYFIKYIHNSFLQIALDIGILGTLSFIGLMVSYLFFSKSEKVYKLIVLIIISHSMIDFDFQFLMIWVIILLMFSLKDNYYKKISVKPIGVFSLMSTATLLLYFLIVTGTYYIDEYTYAAKLYPYYTEAHVKQLTSVEESQEDAKNIADQVDDYNENHLEVNRFLRDYYMNKGVYDLAVPYGNKAVSLNQLDVMDLEIYVRNLLLLLKSDIIRDEFKRREVIEEIKGIDTYILSLHEGLSERAFRVKHQPKLIMTENLKKMQKEALALEDKLLDKESGN